MRRSRAVRRCQLVARSIATRVALVALGAGSCGGSGVPFPSEPIHSIVVGRTSRAELVAALGQPGSSEESPGGSVSIWTQHESSIFGPTRGRTLTVRFGPTGLVRAYEFESSFPEDREPPEPPAAE